MTSPARDDLERKLHELRSSYGEWTYDIPLPGGVWTRGNAGLPHTRLRRCVQIVQDFLGDQFSSARILDLGCLDGLFSFEFALQGAARVVGIDIRRGHIEKCRFAQEALGLKNMDFRVAEVRDALQDSREEFDVVLCSGLLYHLDVPAVFEVIEGIRLRASRLAVFDTHISLAPEATVEYRGCTYAGHWYHEHTEQATAADIERASLASYGNRSSFLLSRPSLVNALGRAGFSSVLECYNPPHLNFGRPGIECRDRCTFIAMCGRPASLHTSPVVNTLTEDWPEGALTYAPAEPPLPPLRSRVKHALRCWLRGSTPGH